MKLKYINVNGYGVLAQDTGFNEGLRFIVDNRKGMNGLLHEVRIKLSNEECYTVLFAEKELNLEGVPILPNWRDFEIEQEAKQYSIKRHDVVNYELVKAFIEGYKHNKAKYTEEDLRKVISDIRTALAKNNYNHYAIDYDSIIQSLKKIPKYIDIDNGEIKEIIY